MKPTDGSAVCDHGRLKPSNNPYDLRGIKVYGKYTGIIARLLGKSEKVIIGSQIYTINKKSADNYLYTYQDLEQGVVDLHPFVKAVTKGLLESRLTKVANSLQRTDGPTTLFASQVINQLTEINRTTTIHPSLVFKASDIKEFTEQIMRIAQLSHPSDNAAALLATYLLNKPKDLLNQPNDLLNQPDDLLTPIKNDLLTSIKNDLLTSIKNIKTDTDMIKCLLTAQTTIAPYKDQTLDAFAQIFRNAEDDEEKNTFVQQLMSFYTPITRPDNSLPKQLEAYNVIVSAQNEISKILQIDRNCLQETDLQKIKNCLQQIAENMPTYI